jgi:DNA-binding transcriptional MerR regulator
MPDHQLITIKEAAKRLGVDVRTVRRIIDSGDLESFIIDHSDRRRYARHYLDAEQVALLRELREKDL